MANEDHRRDIAKLSALDAAAASLAEMFVSDLRSALGQHRSLKIQYLLISTVIDLELSQDRISKLEDNKSNFLKAFIGAFPVKAAPPTLTCGSVPVASAAMAAYKMVLIATAELRDDISPTATRTGPVFRHLAATESRISQGNGSSWPDTKQGRRRFETLDFACGLQARVDIRVTQPTAGNSTLDEAGTVLVKIRDRQQAAAGGASRGPTARDVTSRGSVTSGAVGLILHF
ncbi:hypothetical protein EVAR_50525_1 [Eumeta japonica]|uniref:Uncharacterized protein n=1 Tax=Eumeta variegata TaxID=151549 RepID=A0A4C1X556_EUMVA|nr:hypothetical protein EVAR_50525_1 [Eumeta japonica]